jgi:hypothetical protein
MKTLALGGGNSKRKSQNSRLVGHARWRTVFGHFREMAGAAVYNRLNRRPAAAPMDPECCKQIERLYHATLELEEGRRAAFLKQACAGDESLRQEVKAALANGSTNFLEAPAWPEAARALRRLKKAPLCRVAPGENYAWSAGFFTFRGR